MEKNIMWPDGLHAAFGQRTGNQEVSMYSGNQFANFFLQNLSAGRFAHACLFVCHKTMLCNRVRLQA